MTKTALAKLPFGIRENLETKANVLFAEKKQNNNRVCTEKSRELRGYLECLKDMGILTDPDVRCLYLYYKDISNPFNRESSEKNTQMNSIFRRHGEDFFGKIPMDRITDKQVEEARIFAEQEVINLTKKYGKQPEDTCKELFCNYVFGCFM